ncbi:leucine zipper protein 1 [Phascolarctos cinereus]|uniref:Leucine zipper protein 1 n=1 Tax=Phascolarctos cinereus TaxID=38626 RepID=A0A6P5K0Q6_PHACI|nr:leucine zipper protein 1 [Phascolarctos cinereus]XP_020838702.1 leucine zipper protein 1 [Phascolarctos cinereus]XP_020838703.1 leucine zipper protein 1 [Phascolarctos cinereus]XP_020838704.1 leucine zipper protein 1 [Phascolarctos cinereus]XP_020838705.1 leucine zipper protein 1 [Phascolarctos cinereus]
MAEYSGYKEVTSSRHLRFKLQSLGRRLDELEEATKSLQKAEDELLDLQDKVIQAEGSNSSMLAEVEALRKRVLKIEGKDEEIKRAEDLCQLMKEKLEEEESLTRELKAEIERLQKRMAELEKLEEAFGRSKNDCTQLCLSLNEERNLTKKISSELETLRVKVKELETSEDRLDKTEQSLVSELEKLKSLTLSFVSERKYLNDRDRENEKLIKELTQKLEQNNKVNLVDHPRNASTLLDRNDLRIEDGISSTLPSKEARRKGMLDYRKQGENETRNKSENEKNRDQEDNKVKDLNQEIEKLKTQIKHYESLEEELKKTRAQNNDLKDSYLSEQNKNKVLTSQLEEVKLQLKNQKDLENGEVESEESFLVGKGRQHERPKYRGLVNESPTSRYKSRELSPQHKRGERPRYKELVLRNDNAPHNSRSGSGSSAVNRRAAKASGAVLGMDNVSQDAKRPDDNFATGPPLNEGKRAREQPPVLSRYPPAAQEHRGLKGASKPGHENGLKGKVEKTSRVFNDASHGDRATRTETTSASAGNRVLRVNRVASLDTCLEAVSAKKILNPSGGNQGSSGLAAELGTSKAADPLAPSRRSSSEGLSKCKRPANGQEAESSPPSLKPPVLSKASYGSRSQEDILQGFAAISKEEHDQPVSVVMEDSSQHEAFRCRVIKPGGRERLDLEDDMDMDSLVTAKLVNTTIPPEPESKRQPRSRAALRTPLFDNDRDTGADTEPGKPVRSTAAAEFQEASGSGVKSRRPFSPREALRSKAVIKPVIIDKDVKEVMGGVGAEAISEKPKPTSRSVPNKMTSCITIYPVEVSSPRGSTSEAPRERHTSTSNIQVVPSEMSSVTNHISLPFEISINKNDITRQIADADPVGDLPPRNRPETVVSRSSITIKPSEPGERSSQEPPSESLRWKSHRPPLEMEPSDAKHVTVRSAWRTRRDLNSLEDPPAQRGKNVDPPNAYTQRSSTDFSELERPRPSPFERGMRRGAGNPGDGPEPSSRRTQSSLTVSEVLTRRSRVGDSVTAAALNHPAGLEEAEGSNPNSFRWQHNCVERPELPAKRPPELLRVRAEERVRRAKHSSEEN